MMPAPDVTAPPPPESPAMGGGQQQDPRPMLLQVLKKAKAMADEAGIDFEELVNEVTGESAGMESGEGGSPRPPSPSALGSM